MSTASMSQKTIRAYLRLSRINQRQTEFIHWSVKRDASNCWAFLILHDLSLCGPCFSSSNVFLFCWAAFLSISLLASVFPVPFPLSFLFLQHCLIHARMSEWGRPFMHWHFLALMEWVDDTGSRPAAWSYFPVQCSFWSLRVFYRTFVVGKDTY